jgi:hypothetical protein
MSDIDTSTVPNVLQEALRVVDGDRGKFYGHPLDNHGNTADFWNAYIERRTGKNPGLGARDVCNMMVLLKISRDANMPKEDNLTDICGYARNAQMIRQEEERREYEAQQELSAEASRDITEGVEALRQVEDKIAADPHADFERNLAEEREIERIPPPGVEKRL